MLIDARKKRHTRTPKAVLERRRLRQHLEAAIERAIAMLDDLDGDADLEPVNGAMTWFDQRLWAHGGDSDEREDVSEGEAEQCEGEGEDCDAEADDGWSTFGSQWEVRDPLQAIPDHATMGGITPAELDRRQRAHRERRSNVEPLTPLVRVNGRTWRVELS